MKAHGLGEDHPGEAQVGIVGGSGLAGAEDADGFTVTLLLDLGMTGEEPEREAEGVGGGLMTGEQNSEALVAHLLVAHAAVGFGGGGVWGLGVCDLGVWVSESSAARSMERRSPRSPGERRRSAMRA